VVPFSASVTYSVPLASMNVILGMARHISRA
jgi:hypothetical protein